MCSVKNFVWLNKERNVFFSTVVCVIFLKRESKTWGFLLRLFFFWLFLLRGPSPWREMCNYCSNRSDKKREKSFNIKMKIFATRGKNTPHPKNFSLTVVRIETSLSIPTSLAKIQHVSIKWAHKESQNRFKCCENIISLSDDWIRKLI